MSTAVHLSARDRWERDSIHSVGASELAAIVGADPRRGQLSVYAAKVAKKLDEPEHSWLMFGRRVEAAILDGFGDRTGIVFRHNAGDDLERFYHPDQKRLSATPDGLFDLPEPGCIEAKAVAYMKRDEWTNDTPLHYQIQGQAQMACTGRPRCDLVALLYGVFITDPVTLRPKADFMAHALAAVDKFWWHVENQTPPEADGKPDTKHAIKRLWPDDNGKAVALGADVQALAEAWDVARLRTKQAEENEEELRNKLRARMGDHLIAYLPDKSSLVSRGPQRTLKRWLAHDLKKALKSAHGER